MGIKVENLSKKFKNKEVLNNININIDEGMYGLLGPNGAGKTTLMRILTGLLPKTKGEVKINNIPIKKRKKIREIVGYLPQEFSFYPNMSVFETLDYFASLSGIKVSRHNIYGLLEKVHLKDACRLKTKVLSGGMKRRLGIAVALISNPQILIVDEPTAGLDPEERIRFRKLLSSFSNGKTVLLSTHISEDIALSCERLTILNKGTQIYEGKVSKLISSTEGKVWSLEVEKESASIIDDKFEIVSSIVEGDKIKYKLLSKIKPSEKAVIVQPTLEDAYMYAVKGCKYVI